MDLQWEFQNQLICLAECRIDLTTWTKWWTAHSAEVKKMIGSGDFVFLNCVPSSLGPNNYMLKCQNGAERYLKKNQIPFEHSDLYEKAAEREFQMHWDKIDQERRLEQEKEQKLYRKKAQERKVLLDYRIPDTNMEKSGLRTLLLPVNDLEIIKLLIEWTELLAQERYKEALEMFLVDKNDDLDWTPELLESAVYTYGCPGYTREEAERKFGFADYKVTSLQDSPDKEKIITDIDISSDFGWMSKDDLAVIHYEEVPLNGEMSDLTARFFVRRLNENRYTLAFIDLHVM